MVCERERSGGECQLRGHWTRRGVRPRLRQQLQQGSSSGDSEGRRDTHRPSARGGSAPRQHEVEVDAVPGEIQALAYRLRVNQLGVSTGAVGCTIVHRDGGTAVRVAIAIDGETAA